MPGPLRQRAAFRFWWTFNPQRAGEKAAALADEYGVPAMGCAADITKQAEIEALRDLIVGRFGRLDILINNAANNPKMEASAEVNFSRLENFPLAQWEADIAVGLTGAFLCSKVLEVIWRATAAE